MTFQENYAKYLNIFNDCLNANVVKIEKNIGGILAESMIYALSGGGKRIRPVLALATAELLGLEFDKVKKFAFAIECIHSYSLVHDDLPAMDNDDYRRGKLSTHKKFGEAYGILAGDALLNYAFESVLDEDNLTSTFDVKALKILADCAGAKGMILGQVYDLQNEKNPKFTEELLYKIYENKTAKLIMAPILIASILSGSKYFTELKEFGYNLGITFQIVDDIMDEEGDLGTIGKTPHKDKEVDKLTSVKVFGLDGAKEKAEEHYNICKNILKKIPNSEFLSQLTDKLFVRKS